eukprot:superscaffoldBa00000424_g4631
MHNPNGFFLHCYLMARDHKAQHCHSGERNICGLLKTSDPLISEWMLGPRQLQRLPHRCRRSERCTAEKGVHINCRGDGRGM